MSRKRLTETIDAEIANGMADMSKLQDRYDKLAENSRIFRSRSVGARPDSIMDACLKSGKSLEEIMIFLKP